MARRKKRESTKAQIRDKILAKQNHRCYYCNDPFKGSGDKIKAPTIEHLTKQAEGGTDDLENIVLACKECNSHRGDYSPEEWKRICKNFIKTKRKRGFMANDNFEDFARFNEEIPRTRVKMRVIEVLGRHGR